MHTILSRKPQGGGKGRPAAAKQTPTPTTAT
jgi:hypothetical protein